MQRERVRADRGADELAGHDLHGRRRALPPRRRRRGHAREGVASRARSGSCRSTTARVAHPPAARGRRAAATSLEIPAGKRDVEGEAPLETAKRELAEEIGKRAASWEEIKVFYTSPGFSDERVWWYLARDLSRAPGAEPEPGERIEIVPWPLDRARRGDRRVRGLKVADRAVVARAGARARHAVAWAPGGGRPARARQLAQDWREGECRSMTATVAPPRSDI